LIKEIRDEEEWCLLSAIENVELNLNSKMNITVVVPENPVIVLTDVTAEKASGPGL